MPDGSLTGRESERVEMRVSDIPEFRLRFPVAEVMFWAARYSYADDAEVESAGGETHLVIAAPSTPCFLLCGSCAAVTEPVRSEPSRGPLPTPAAVGLPRGRRKRGSA